MAIDVSTEAIVITTSVSMTDLPLLPEGSDQHKMVAAAIAALQGKQ